MPTKDVRITSDRDLSFERHVVHLLQHALTGKRDEAARYALQLSRDPSIGGAFAEALRNALHQAMAPQGPFRSETMARLPVDMDSRAELLRAEYPVVLDDEPILPAETLAVLHQIVSERRHVRKLLDAGLTPSRSALFVGAPGCGKTLSARWLARELDLPLFVLDLASVVSSFLGRTGSNVHNVFDFAKGLPCVLFLDEVDTVAKGRNDEAELGELKRLVTVLLQELDQWPAQGIVLGATNHPELLDRALWRRFEIVLNFDVPTPQLRRAAILRALSGQNASETTVEILDMALEFASYSDIRREIDRARRSSVVTGLAFDVVVTPLIRDRKEQIPKVRRREIARRLITSGHSQRETSEITGVSRDTLRTMSSGGRNAG